MAAAEDNYVCQLDERTEEKAKKELNEDPKDRLNAVEALRTWIQQQPHLTFPRDTMYLLYFLRTAKFSQLRARTLVENYAKAMVTYAHWFRDIDTHDPGLLDVIEAGYIIPLPKRDKNGCCVLLHRPGVTDKNGELFAVPQRVRTSALVARHDLRDENIQVNGNTFIIDFSGVGPKHMTQMSIQDMRNWMNCWQNSFPGRFKSFHYYNIGAVFDAMMTLFRPMMSKKLQERIHVHETAESLYKSVGMDVLPIEYLPDDYTGPSAGSIQQIIQKLKEDVMEQKFRQHMLRFSSAQSINIDESKRPAYEPVNESFRKLAVD